MRIRRPAVRHPEAPPSRVAARPATSGRAAHRLTALAVSAGLALSLVGGATAGAAQEPGPTGSGEPQPTTPTTPTAPVDPNAPPAEPPPLAPLPTISPALAGVSVTSRDYDAAGARRDSLAEQRDAAIRTENDRGRQLVALTERDRRLTVEAAGARARAERWETQMVRLARELRDMAIAAYISGTGDNGDPLLTLDTEQRRDRATQDVAVGSLATRQLADLARAQRTARRARGEEAAALTERRQVRDSIAEARATRDRARADKERLGIELLDATVELEAESRLATVDGADFPLVVLDAYWKAAELMSLLAPGCGITWWALAGIGKTESGHGTHAGSEVRADGSLTKPIIGIPLTGAGGTAAIGDSDGGLVDGDPTVDRAAGPMQFIPQTWARWGRDGDGNGRIEIQNIYDAAAGAAAYLCAGGPVTDDTGLMRAYFSYNHSLEYVAIVLERAQGYALTVEIPPIA